MLYSFIHGKLFESYQRSVVSKSPNFCDWWGGWSALLISSLTSLTSSSSFWLSAPSFGSVSVSSRISYCAMKKSISILWCWKLSSKDPPTLHKLIQKFAILIWTVHCGSLNSHSSWEKEYNFFCSRIDVLHFIFLDMTAWKLIIFDLQEQARLQEF